MRWFIVLFLLLLAAPAWAASNVLSWTDNSTNEALFRCALGPWSQQWPLSWWRQCLERCWRQ